MNTAKAAITTVTVKLFVVFCCCLLRGMFADVNKNYYDFETSHCTYLTCQYFLDLKNKAPLFFYPQTLFFFFTLRIIFYTKQNTYNTSYKQLLVVFKSKGQIHL